MTQNELKELQEITKKYNNDDFVCAAIPRVIRNNGKDKEVVEIILLHKVSKTQTAFIHRDGFSTLRNQVKKAFDRMVDDIHRTIVLEAEKKNKAKTL